MGALLLALLAAGDASQVMASYGDRVVEVQVLGTSDTNADTRSVIGSGFYVSDDGLLVTNYHVVSDLVWWPLSHRLQVVRGEDKRKGVLVEIDPPNDLAVIRVEGAVPGHLELATEPPARGTRLFSLGHPHDLGLSIVEGTYNGLVEGSLAEQLHFSGSLNSGVSGGPAIDEQGRVVGVNVASRGNQVSFLVPVRFAEALLARARERKQPPDLLARVRETVLESQELLSAELLAVPMATTTLGGWTLPAGWPKKDLRAWGGPLNEDDPDDLFTVTGYRVRGEAVTVLRPGSEDTGAVTVWHRLYERKGTGPLQLYLRVGAVFESGSVSSPGDGEEFHTRWRCDSRVFSQGGARLKSHVCLRAYKKLDGLYDAVLRTMTFDSPDAVVESELLLHGFSPANIDKLCARFVEAIAWKP